MSGPVTTDDAPADREASHPDVCQVEITDSHVARVGDIEVRRALPRRTRRTVGSWCFADHMGPATVGVGAGLDVGPHPHIGLQTVTWLTQGEILHRDSLGSEQLIRPGQLNLMTAGRGVSHSEEGTGYTGTLEGIQLWVAQPEETRHGHPGFEHHPELPVAELGNGAATVIIGELGGASSPARRDTDHLGVELDLRAGRTVVPLRADFEYALVVLDGEVDVDGHAVTPGHLAYMGLGRDEGPLSVAERATALLIGGVPFPEPILMWWNYVARTRDEVGAAHRDWSARSERFGTVASELEAIDVGPPPWEAPLKP